MYQLKLPTIERYYAKIINMAISAFERQCYVEVIYHLDNAAILANSVNWIYKDDMAEELTKKIAKHLLPSSSCTKSSIPNRYIFYDQIGNGTVLGLQYLNALKSWGAEFLYILEPGMHTRKEEILADLRSYNRAQVLILDDDPKVRLENIYVLYEKIINYRAEKAFLHAPAEGAFGVILWQALDHIKRYRIVPGDHHFYLGTSVTDYAIEFRPYGVRIAKEKRGFLKEQILLQPYYPIIRSAKFIGFPKELIDGRVVIVSGGSFYKTYGRNDTFFRIIRTMVDRNPNIIVLYAGGGDSRYFIKCISRYKLENSLILLGYRKDINEVIRNCDIYLGTYPFCGGLMSQYAAVNGKPILQYTSLDIANNFIEDILGYPTIGPEITFTDLNKFHKHADKLIRDVGFRTTVGEYIKKMVISSEVFNHNLYTLIKTNQPYEGPERNIDYNAMIIFYMSIINCYSNIVERIFLGRYKQKVLWLFPRIIPRLMSVSILSSLWKRLCRN